MKNFLKIILAYLRYLLGFQIIPDPLNNINIETTSRCNLKCKFCAYDKRDLLSVPHTTMSQEKFEDVVNQSIELGYENIGLTPTTGDIFMDKDIINKLEYLEGKEKLKGYYLYTNFIPINFEKIEKILNLKKLTNFGISIYGNDLDTFINLSGGSVKSYEKLIQNLEFFKKKINETHPKFKIEISLRTITNFNIKNAKDEVSLIINDLLSKKLIQFSQNSEFNNWGGLIKNDHIKNLGIKLISKKKRKIGSCSLIYSRLIVGASGKVHACACRDANYTLAIGDLNEKKLKEIVNLKNNKYKDLILAQEQNNFPDVCESCDFYKSIYQNNDFIWSFRDKKIKNYNLKKVLEILNNR